MKERKRLTRLLVTVTDRKVRRAVVAHFGARVVLVVARPVRRRLEVGERVAVHLERPLRVAAVRDRRRLDPAQRPREALQVRPVRRLPRVHDARPEPPAHLLRDVDVAAAAAGGCGGDGREREEDDAAADHGCGW